jgi:hypothetical protein
MSPLHLAGALHAVQDGQVADRLRKFLTIENLFRLVDAS